VLFDLTCLAWVPPVADLRHAPHLLPLLFVHLSIFLVETLLFGPFTARPFFFSTSAHTCHSCSTVLRHRQDICPLVFRYLVEVSSDVFVITVLKLFPPLPACSFTSPEFSVWCVFPPSFMCTGIHGSDHHYLLPLYTQGRCFILILFPPVCLGAKLCPSDSLCCTQFFFFPSSPSSVFFRSFFSMELYLA